MSSSRATLGTNTSQPDRYPHEVVASTSIGQLSEVRVLCTEQRIPWNDRKGTGIRPSPSKLDAIANIPKPTDIEQLRPFHGLNGYLRKFIPRYSIIAAPLTKLLRNRVFASKRACKLPIGGVHRQQKAFRSLRNALSNPTVVAFPLQGDTPSRCTPTQEWWGKEQSRLNHSIERVHHRIHKLTTYQDRF